MTEVRYVKSIIRLPRWYRHPFRRRRMRKMMEEHDRRVREDPVYGAIVVAEERAFLFGDQPRDPAKPGNY